jgi:hypothetical protein
MKRYMDVLRAVVISAAVSFGVAAAAPEGSAVCDEFRALGWPDAGKLSRFALTDTLERGARESAELHFYNIDIDGDDIEDPLTVGCSASEVRADPCTLNIALSSGDSIEFEAWYLYLVRHRGLIYAITANERGAENRIYRVGPKDISAACPSL